MAVPAIVFYVMINGIAVKSAIAQTGYLIALHDGVAVECQKVKLTEDGIKCYRDGVVYLYAVQDVKNISSKETVIFPYPEDRILDYEFIGDEECAKVTDSIRGPLLLEEDPKIFLLLGKLLENGKCVNKNLAKAKHYYLKAGVPGKQAYAMLMENEYRKVEKANLDSQFLDSLQQSANRYRAKQAEKSSECQQSCMIEDDVENKFRYSVKCYEDCMKVGQ